VRAGISEPVAAARLRELVDDGLLAREDYRDPGQRTRQHYRLTDKGADRVPARAALLHRLADRARDEGVTQFTALMLSDNRPMRRLLADLGPTRLLSSAAGAVELAVDLHPDARPGTP